jgi:hypothetical protein
VDDLMPDARRVQPRDGEVVPSVRRLMTALRIGAPKATEVRDRLLAEATSTPQGQRELTRDVLARVEANGIVPPAAELAARYGLDQSGARLLADMAHLAARQRDQQPTGSGGPDTGAAPGSDHGDAGDTVPAPAGDPDLPAPSIESATEPATQVRADGDTDDTAPPAPRRPAVVWPIVLLAAPAFVAIWSGWVGLGTLTGFGVVHPLPGIWDDFSLNSAITLPIGVETYGAYALYVWLSGRVPGRARQFAKWSALGSLAIGALGQVAYHLLVAAGVSAAPWWITTAVACLPVAVLGMGAALAHLVREDH